MRVRSGGGELDYGSMSALTHWPYLLNARQKQIWHVHGERCGTQARMYARELISCQQCRACKSECPYRERPCAIERLAAIPRWHSFRFFLFGPCSVANLLLGIWFLDCRALISDLSLFLCVPISENYMLLDIIFLLKSHAIMFYKVLLMKLSHAVWSLIRPGAHTYAETLLESAHKQSLWIWYVDWYSGCISP